MALMHSRFSLGILMSFGLWAPAYSQEYHIHRFSKVILTQEFWAEGATAGDFNNDGVLDVAAGPYIYHGPQFTSRQEFYPATESYTVESEGNVFIHRGFPGALSARNAYANNFLSFDHDFNDDGWDDILVIGFPGEGTYWYANPQGRPGHWVRHLALPVTDNESPTLTDINGDGRPDLVCNSGGYFGYASYDPNAPEEPWAFRPVTPKGSWARFTHGIGIGDVDGDGKMDIMERGGWWKQTDEGPWELHPEDFAPGGSSQMYAYDVDDDGDNDVLTCLAAHGYGVAWYEHIEKNGEIQFKQHIIINATEEENAYGVKFSQPHAMVMADMNADGILDLITGKRFWAHGPTGDAEPNGDAVLYWFEIRRNAGGVEFIPHLIDDDSGIGTQVMARDLDGDGAPEVIVGNKKGAFVHRHHVTLATATDWEATQPKRLY